MVQKSSGDDTEIFISRISPKEGGLLSCAPKGVFLYESVFLVDVI
jgi:hypothetical protein